jgi:hypothetical protein
MSKLRKFRPSPAMIVAVLALFVALGGSAYALKKNSVKTKNIKNNAVKTKKIADGAVTTPKFADDATAPDAAKLGGVDATGYQGFCKPGAIKDSLVIVTNPAMSATYTSVGGFNCSSTAGDAVQIRRAGLNDYNVKFAGSDSGSAVVSPLNSAGVPVTASKIADGEFDVKITDGGGFALLAF